MLTIWIEKSVTNMCDNFVENILISGSFPIDNVLFEMFFNVKFKL